VAQDLRKVFVLTAIASSALLVPQSVKASLTINFTDQAGTASTRSFSDTPNNLSVTFSPSTASPQQYVASSSVGLCLYANSADQTGRCGVNGTAANPLSYNFVQMTSSRNIFLTGGFVSAVGGNSNPINISYSANGPILRSIPNSASSTAFDFSPLLVTPTQSLYFIGSGVNTSTRISSFTFEEVPGPLPILGVAAAFQASRRIRKKLKTAK
jgi:hypothetical protein